MVPAEFPLALADRLQAGGVRLEVDNDSFLAQRRSKSSAELAGIMRATGAAQFGFRKTAERAIAENGARIDEMIVRAGAGNSHHYGSGPIPARADRRRPLAPGPRVRRFHRPHPPPAPDPAAAADGGSMTVAAEELQVSEETVRTHTKNILARLEPRNRAHAVAIGLRESLID